MTKNILIIRGHPDPDRSRFGHQLADAYREAAEQAGHSVSEIAIADIEFPLVRSYQEFYGQEAPEMMLQYQKLLDEADHLVIFYPLWLGGLPALLKGFLEQLFRPGFAFRKGDSKWPEKRLQGKSARVVITMGMPAFAYRWIFRAHSLKSLQRNILHFSGIRPVYRTLIGAVESRQPEQYRKWISQIQKLGQRAG